MIAANISSEIKNAEENKANSEILTATEWLLIAILKFKMAAVRHVGFGHLQYIVCAISETKF